MKYYILFILFVFVGCTKVIQLEIPKQTSKLVANSQFTQDSIIIIDLSTTRSILSSEEKKITPTEALLYKNGMYLETLKYQNGYLNSISVAESNTTYKIAITAPGYQKISAEDKLLTTPKIIEKSYKDSVYIGDEGDLFSQANIKISDDEDVKNYYELTMYLKSLNNTVTQPAEDYPLSIEYTDLFYDPLLNDIVIQNENLLNYYPEKLVFSDELFNGQEYTFKINFRTFSIDFYYLNSKNEIGLIVQLRSVTENYYRYSKTLTKHLENQVGDIWDGVSEPGPVFSNVNNGYGVFVGYSQVIDTLYKK